MFLGSVFVPISALSPNLDFVHWFPLRPRRNFNVAATGDLRVHCHFVVRAAPVPDETEGIEAPTINAFDEVPLSETPVGTVSPFSLRFVLTMPVGHLDIRYFYSPATVALEGSLLIEVIEINIIGTESRTIPNSPYVVVTTCGMNRKTPVWNRDNPPTANELFWPLPPAKATDGSYTAKLAVIDQGDSQLPTNNLLATSMMNIGGLIPNSLQEKSVTLYAPNAE
jgi:hypothetical protein